MQKSRCLIFLLPPSSSSRIERGKKRQSIIPDMRISLPVEGNLVKRLHKIKMISSSKTRYKLHWAGQEALRAVDKRAGYLNNEYLKKARSTDLLYCGTAPGTTGPVETELGTMGEVQGIVVGAVGEGSEALHTHIYHLALSRVRVTGPQVGRRGQVRQEAAEVAITTGFLCVRGEGAGRHPPRQAGGAGARDGRRGKEEGIRPGAREKVE